MALMAAGRASAPSSSGRHAASTLSHPFLILLAEHCGIAGTLDTPLPYALERSLLLRTRRQQRSAVCLVCTPGFFGGFAAHQTGS